MLCDFWATDLSKGVMISTSQVYGEGYILKYAKQLELCTVPGNSKSVT